jgi:hypothetical protein
MRARAHKRLPQSVHPDEREQERCIRTVDCPNCEALAGEPCWNTLDIAYEPHRQMFAHYGRLLAWRNRG